MFNPLDYTDPYIYEQELDAECNWLISEELEADGVINQRSQQMLNVVRSEVGESTIKSSMYQRFELHEQGGLL